MEQVQNDKDRLVLAISLVIGFVPASLVKETMPCLQRGQGMEPGGPWPPVIVLFVEHR